MESLVLNPKTDLQLQQFIKSPAHATLLVGAPGSGKLALSTQVAEQILEVPSLADYPYKLLISDIDGKAIGIDEVRQLEHFLSLKVPRQTAYNRVVILDSAHKLTPEAQNALLKTLEEPPDATLIFLNTAHEQALLPTVRSRSQKINVLRPEKTVLIKHFKNQKYDETAIDQAYAISGGLPGLMQAMLAEQEHPLLRATQYSRQLLQSSPYERLIIADDLAKQRDFALDVTFILQQMARVSLQNAKGTAARRWKNILSAAYAASEALLINAQPKLVVTNLCLNL